MNNDDKAAIFDFLVDLLSKRGYPPDKANALLDYLRETSANDTSEKLLHRTSELFGKDITSIYASHVATRIEVADHKIEVLKERMDKIENSKNKLIQWDLIQGIAWFVSLCAALLALYLGLTKN